MPTISRFFGITIQMYFDDHPPPHVHARYQHQNARFAIATGDLLSGNLPSRARRMVEEWIALNRAALAENWARMERGEPMEQIQGLQ